MATFPALGLGGRSAGRGYDEEGQPLTVRYHILSSLLLNELLKQHQMLEEQAARLVELEAEMR